MRPRHRSEKARIRLAELRMKAQEVLNMEPYLIARATSCEQSVLMLPDITLM